jgi:mannose-6-phosphate isomerase-like protein (cupin superfamily)
MFKRFELLCVPAIFLAWAIAVLPAVGQIQPAGPGETKTPAKELPAPAQPYLVMTGLSMEEAIKQLQSGNMTRNLMAGEGIGCRVFLQHEKDVATGQAEVHEGADDVFIIMEGSTTLILGGALDAPKQTQPGEWRAQNITGGKSIKLGKGDVVVVPRGTPHRRVSDGQEVTLMIVKAFAPPAK